MPRRVTVGDRLRYTFDRSMDHGFRAQVGLLGLITLAIMLAGGAVVALLHLVPGGGEPLGFVEASWQALMRALDAGNLQGDEGWPYRLVMLAMTLAGIFILSTLIGILSAAVNSRLEQLRKGRSLVIETGHTVILNWSPSIFDVLSELAAANASRRRAAVVVMADRDKVEMEDAIAARVPDLKTTRVICRSGDPTDLFDLQIVSLQTARSIIVLAPEGVEEPDALTVKTVLALTNDPDRRPEPYRIAAEIRDRRNGEAAQVVGGREVQLVVPDELIGRIVVHSSRQAGLSGVYAELLSFEGVEIYVGEPIAALDGMSFADAAGAFRTCALMGLRTAAGEIRLNPAADQRFAPGDRPIVIAEDDSVVRLNGRAGPVTEADLAPVRPHERRPERILVLGWNRRGPVIASELSRYVAKGSSLLIASDAPFLADDAAGVDLGSALSLDLRTVDPSRRLALDALQPETFDHVIVLSDGDHLPPRAADTRTLVTLLHLRRRLDASEARTTVVSEMIDVRNRRLAEVARADDFVVSNRLVSLMLAQASEQESLSDIFEELLGKGGCEIVMRPAADYVVAGREVSFYAVLEAASRRSETAVGWCCGRGAEGSVVLNPDKAQTRVFGPDDRIVVLAAD